MNDDLCGDWFEPDDEYNSQFPRAADEGGWGIDESMYTSQLDKSKLSAEQIAAAERMAAEIERESRSKVKSTNMGGLGGYRPEPAASYADSQTASFLNKQKATLPPQSARPQPPAAPQQAKVTPPQQQFLNECKVVLWLQEEIGRVLNLIGTLGDPQPKQAARLLNQYTASVTSMIPFSPPDVKQAVIAKFEMCNWDVIRRLPTQGSKPPNGKTLCDLIFELGVYFCGRTNQVGPPPGFVEAKLAEYRAKKQAAVGKGRAGAGAAAAAAANRNPPIPNVGGGPPHPPGKGYKGYQNNGGKGKGDGKGYHGKGKGGEGKGKGGDGKGKGKGYNGKGGAKGGK